VREKKMRVMVLAMAAGLAVGGVSATGLAAGGKAAGGASPQEAYPGVRTLQHESGRVEAFYGAPMTTAADPQTAALEFLASHGEAFGVGQLELEIADSTTIRDGRFTAFQLNQFVDGVPVRNGVGRVLVLDRGTDHAVVYAAGKFATNAPGELGDTAFVAADQAMASVRSDFRFREFDGFRAPELVAYFNQGDGVASAQTRLAWSIKGKHVGYPVVPEAYEILIDAQTGEELEVISLVHGTDVEGSVRGLASPGTAPDIATNPPAELDLPLLEVVLRGGGSAVSGLDGSFIIDHGGTDPVTLDATMTGPWVRVDDQAAPELSLSEVVTPPGPAELVFNTSPSQFTTAQVNTLLHTNMTYDLLKSRAPGFTGLDRQTVANVNLNDSCNAFFSGFDLSINFFRALGGCVNTAYSSVVAHEYGHFVVNRLGLAQGAFGEGYGDSIAIILLDTGLVGEQFFGAGSGAIRNPEAARQQTPCTSPGLIHTCGQQLGGTWRWTRLNLNDTMTSAEALDTARDLFAGWSMITLGGAGDDAIAPRTAIEVLTVDDDDGIIGNGTPNYEQICQAFDRHGVDCPELDSILVVVDERPEALGAGESGRVLVSIEDVSASLVDGSLDLNVVADGATQAIDFTPAGDQFEATIPGQDAFTDLGFFITAQATDGDSVRVPAEGEFTLPVGEAIAVVNFEDPAGWTVENIAIEDGAWNFGQPLGAGDDRDQDPPADFDGSGAAALTDNAAGNSDVDGGPTRLLSPVYDLSDATDPQLSYARWFRNDDRDEDNLLVELSDDGGTTWTQIEDIGDTPAGWVVNELRIADVLPLTDGFRVRFSATDNPNNSVTEAGVDRFWILDAGEATCAADFDGDGDLTVFDFLAFQSAFDAMDPAADFDADGEFTIFDFLAYSTAFDAGCP